MHSCAPSPGGLSAKLTGGCTDKQFFRITIQLQTCGTRVGTKHLPCTSFVQRQVPAQPLRSLDSSGLPLRLCAALCLRKTKWLPTFFAPLPPPLAAVARRPLAALPCGPPASASLRQPPVQGAQGANPVEPVTACFDCGFFRMKPAKRSGHLHVRSVLFVSLLSGRIATGSR